ncbi:spore coat U domain-containing protein [Bordetella tumulicola]|uniref:Csu type fimbrial protein n=1 Tax=Bordetella tumulicola TaxID=1649133 RepID=UPI0039EE9116
MNRFTRISLFGVGLVAGIAVLPASAQVYNNTATATFTVNLIIQSDCTIAANPLSFGTSGVLDTNVDAETTVSVTCSNTTPYNIGLNEGNVTGSTVANRLLAGTTGGNTGTTVAYQLYQDAARATVWGNTQPTDTLSGVGTGTAQTIPVYGRVPPQTTPTADTYQSTVTATVFF